MYRSVPRLAPLLVVLFALLLSAGCGTPPRSPEGAVDAARGFLNLRMAGDARTAHAQLTARAQKLISVQDVSRVFQETEISFEDLGQPWEVDVDVVRVPVRNLVIVEGERIVQWPEVWLTLRYEAERWRVAWAEPLFDEAAQAYFNSQYGQGLELAESIIAIDPYHYRGYLEQHFIYRSLEQLREADAALASALEYATPVELPAVLDARARFKLQLNVPDDALEHAREALERARPYIPSTYSYRWQADTLVVAARAAMALGDRALAGNFAEQAAAVDPTNATLAVFRQQLAGAR